MKEKVKKRSWKIAAGILLLVISLWAGYWCSAREGFYEDEVWTFLLADSYYNPSLADDPGYFHQWNEGEYYQDAISVQLGERFDYASVNSNQIQDTHPPLYYDVIHTLGSLVPDTFCVPLAYLANVIFMVVTCLFCGLIAFQITEDHRISLFVMCLYGFSTMAVASAMYLRMYMLLTMFAVISTYLHLKLLRKDQDRYHWLFLLCITGVVEWFGGMSQYFFWVYQALLSLGFFILLLSQKKFRRAICYVAMEICCGMIYLFGWPYIIDHTLSGGNSPQNNLDLLSEGLQKLLTLGKYLNTLFGGAMGFLPLAIIAIVILIVCGIRWKWFSKESFWKIAAPELLLLLTGTLYVLIVIQIVPSFAVTWPTDTIAVRYFWPAYPALVLFVGTMIGFLIKKLAPRRNGLILCGILVAILVNQYAADNTVDTLLYRGTAETVNVIESEKTRAIHITDGSYKYVVLLNLLATHSEVLNVHPEDFQSALEGCMTDGKMKEDMILYVEWDYREGVEQVLQAEGIKYENINPAGSVRLHNVFKIYAD